MTLLPTVAAPSRRSIPDGACQFTRGMGMSCTWEKERGFGERSWRSMVRGAHNPLRAALERHSSLLSATLVALGGSARPGGERRGHWPPSHSLKGLE